MQIWGPNHVSVRKAKKLVLSLHRYPRQDSTRRLLVLNVPGRRFLCIIRNPQELGEYRVHMSDEVSGVPVLNTIPLLVLSPLCSFVFLPTKLGTLYGDPLVDEMSLHVCSAWRMNIKTKTVVYVACNARFCSCE